MSYDNNLNDIDTIIKFSKYLLIVTFIALLFVWFVFPHYIPSAAILFITLVVLSYLTGKLLTGVYLAHRDKVEKLERQIDKLHSELLTLKDK